MPMIIGPLCPPCEGEDFRPRIAPLAASLAHQKFGTDPGLTAVLVEAAGASGSGQAAETNLKRFDRAVTNRACAPNRSSCAFFLSRRR